MSIVRAAVTNHGNMRYLLICSDSRSPEALAFYFEYRYPPNIRAMSVGEFLTTPSAVDADRVFVFAHNVRSHFITDTYHEHTYDLEIASAGIAPAYDADGVSLRETEDARGLREKLAKEAEKRASSY